MKILRILLILLAIGAGYTFYFFQSHQTDYSFELESADIGASVEVVFDDMAVPHIYAESENDALYALGYVHAMERLWQMDLLRRAGAGELSALLGEDMVANDQYLRTLGMREAADRVTEDFLTRGPARIQQGMAAYLAGVNRFIAKGQTPLEYELLGMDPEPFDTHDVYCATGLMAYSFAIHLKTEPILDWMKGHLGPDYLADLATGVDGFTTIPVDSVQFLQRDQPSGGGATATAAAERTRCESRWRSCSTATSRSRCGSPSLGGSRYNTSV